MAYFSRTVEIFRAMWYNYYVYANEGKRGGKAVKICVIFTGGTIGSRTNGSVVELGTAPYALLEGLDMRGLEIVTAEPYNSLSEELDAEKLFLLAECVRDSLPHCDGIIITHGTDTLVYTAAFLGLMFGDCGKGIALVSSGYPLDDPRANGRQNLEAAAAFLRAGHKGVAVPWYREGKTAITPALRLMRQLPYDDVPIDLGGEALVYAGGALHGVWEYVPKPCPFGRLEEHNRERFGRVMYLKALPVMYYPEPTEDISAVLIESYHSGTLCADESFTEFMHKADVLGIPVFIAGAGGREADYETTAKYKALGAVPLSKASPDVRYMELCLAVSYGVEGGLLKEFMIRTL